MIEQELNEYICDLCEEKGIPLEIRWRGLGDDCTFYRDGQEFTIACLSWRVDNIEDIKHFIVDYIEDIWDDEECWEGVSRSDCRVAIYVMDIIDMNDWYVVSFGGSISDR